MDGIEDPTHPDEGLASGRGSARQGASPPDARRDDTSKVGQEGAGPSVAVGSVVEGTPQTETPASKGLAVPQGKGLRRVVNREKARAVVATVRDRAVALTQDERARATASAVGAVAGAAALAMVKAAVEDRAKAQSQLGQGAKRPAGGLLEALLAETQRTGGEGRGVLDRDSGLSQNRRGADGGSPRGPEGRAGRPGSFYPTEPGRLEASNASSGQLRAHPSINALTLEVSMTGFSSYCFAIEWPGVIERTFFDADDLEDDWRLPFVTEPPTPLKLRRVSSTTLEFMFLDPAGVPEGMWDPPSGKKRTARQMSESLSDIHRSTPRWRA